MVTLILIGVIIVLAVFSLFYYHELKVLRVSANQKDLQKLQLQNRYDLITKELQQLKERYKDLNLNLMENEKEIRRLKAQKITSASTGDLNKLKEANKNLSKEISRYKKMLKSKDRYIDKMKGSQVKKQNSKNEAD